MVSQRAYLYDRFVSLNDRFTDFLNHRTKQKLMIEKTFEKKWADNRQRLLQEDEEYQRILRSYRKHNWADALVAPAALIGSMEFVAWLGVKSQVLNFVISLVLAIVFFFVFLYFKAVRVSRKTLDEVEQRITPHTQAIIVNSPNNPSGVVYTEETLRGLAALLERKSSQYGHPIYIIADEPYRELVYGGVKVPFIPNLYKNTIVCYSYSKSLSLPGERIGYVYVPSFAEDSAAVYATVSGAARAIGHVCPPTLMQKVVGLCAREQPDLQAYDENRTLLYNSLREMGYECAKPDGAFYLFVKAPGGDANAFSEKAKREHNLLVVPADGFGCPGYFRLSYCVSNDMIRRSLPAFRAMMKAYC